MDHQHTWLTFDCRPMKAAAHQVIDEFESVTGLDPTVAATRLGALARSLPDLDSDEYEDHMRKLLSGNNPGRARRLVDCLGDRTFKAWVLPLSKVFVLSVKWAAFLGAIALVVWLVTR